MKKQHLKSKFSPPETTLEHQLISLPKDELVLYIQSHPETYFEAICLALFDKQPYSWRATWMVRSCSKKNDSRLQKYVISIIETLPKRSGGHQRELLSILLRMEINKDFEGILFDYCVDIWKNISNISSVRFYAFRFLIILAKKYPELSHEMMFLMEFRFINSLSSGIKQSVIKLSQELT